MCIQSYHTLVLSIVTTLIVIACEPEVNKIQEQEAVQLVNKELLKNINLTYTDSGKIILKITAPELLRFYKSNQSHDEFRQGMLATFYSDGIISNTLTSRYAIRIIEEGKTYLSDQVVLSNTKGEKLETSELIWDERKGMVHTDKFVQLSREDEIVRGYGFESDQNFLKGTIQSIEASFPVSKIMNEELKDE